MCSYTIALSFADLSYVLPATASSYVIIVLLSIVCLHEHVSPQRWAGVAFIVLGAVSSGSPLADRGRVRAYARLQALEMALL